MNYQILVNVGIALAGSVVGYVTKQFLQKNREEELARLMSTPPIPGMESAGKRARMAWEKEGEEQRL